MISKRSFVPVLTKSCPWTLRGVRAETEVKEMARSAVAAF
jgi:hypothetical protein